MTHTGIDARFQLTLSAFTLDVELSLPARGITALFGPSGSGKTTLLRCIAGLEPAPGGRLSIKGEVWQDASHFLPTHRRPLAYVFQEASLFAHLNVRQNVGFGLRRVPCAQRRFALDQAIEWLDIGALLSRMPATLSGGERQRVAIARALATSPKLLLMDEPLAALDHARKNDILPYLERLHDELDIPVLYVSHSPDEVARLADHMVVLDAGHVIADGALTEVFARPDLPLAQGDEASVVLDAVIAQHDPAYHLSRLDFAGGTLWVRHSGGAPGKAVRVRILARDVSLTLTPQTGTSILNILPARIVRISPDRHPAQILVWLEAGGTALCARITRRSADILGLHPGLAVWAQIKSVALLR
jgi:molybdate transport system ATP-binding protein